MSKLLVCCLRVCTHWWQGHTCHRMVRAVNLQLNFSLIISIGANSASYEIDPVDIRVSGPRSLLEVVVGSD